MRVMSDARELSNDAATGADASEPSSEEAPVISGTMFESMRRVARSRLRDLPPGQTLQPTALVNEAWLRLVRSSTRGVEERREFLILAARAMHDVIVEEARRKASLRRGGDRRRELDFDLGQASEAEPEELLALDAALERLSSQDPRKAELVRLRFFVGLSLEDVAEALEVSMRTVGREWRFVRAWLFDELRREDAAPPQDTQPPSVEETM